MPCAEPGPRRVAPHLELARSGGQVRAFVPRTRVVDSRWKESNADDLSEWFYSGKTRALHATHVSTGDCLWSSFPWRPDASAGRRDGPGAARGDRTGHCECLPALRPAPRRRLAWSEPQLRARDLALTPLVRPRPRTRHDHPHSGCPSRPTASTVPCASAQRAPIANTPRPFSTGSRTCRRLRSIPAARSRSGARTPRSPSPSRDRWR